MYEDIKRMLAAAYELEGLLMLADSRGDDTPEIVLTAIREKIEYLAQTAGITHLPACDNTPEPAVEAMPAEETDSLSPLEEMYTDTAEESADAPITQEEAEALIAAYHESTDDGQEDDYELPAETKQEEFQIEDEAKEMAIAMHEYFDTLQETEETPATEAEEQPEPEETDDDEPEMPAEETVVVEEEQQEEAPETTEETTEEGNLPETEDEQMEEAPAVSEEEYNDENDEEEEFVPTEDSDNVPSERITIDEAFIRNKSKDLRNAFSINDSFRFRRELFGNSAAEMADAINLAEAMQTFDEAEEYFYGDLGWDKESDEVKEFMTIIRNHFL